MKPIYMGRLVEVKFAVKDGAYLKEEWRLAQVISEPRDGAFGVKFLNGFTYQGATQMMLQTERCHNWR